MFFTDGRTLALPKPKKALVTAFQFGITVYEGVLKPMSRSDEMYAGVSAEIRRAKGLTLEEHDLMHLYASNLVRGITEIPLGMTSSLGCRLRGMMAAQSSAFHRQHPIRARKKVAA